MSIQSKIDELIGAADSAEKIASEEANEPSPTVLDFRKVAGLLDNAASKMVEKTASPLCKLANERLSNTEELEKEAFDKLALSLNPKKGIQAFKAWRGRRSMAKTQARAAEQSGARTTAEEAGENWTKLNPGEKGKRIKDAKTPTEAAGTKLTNKQIAAGGAGAYVVGDVTDGGEKLLGGGKKNTGNTYVRHQ